MSAERPDPRVPTIVIGIILFILAGVWATVLVSIAARTARAQEGLTAAHERVATTDERSASRIEASWSSYPLTMAVSFPYKDKPEFMRELRATLADFEPKEKQ